METTYDAGSFMATIIQEVRLNDSNSPFLALKAAGEILTPLKSTAKLSQASVWPKFHPNYLLMNL